jgi:hypothetical protein
MYKDEFDLVTILKHSGLIFLLVLMCSLLGILTFSGVDPHAANPKWGNFLQVRTFQVAFLTSFYVSFNLFLYLFFMKNYVPRIKREVREEVEKKYGKRDSYGAKCTVTLDKYYRGPVVPLAQLKPGLFVYGGPEDKVHEWCLKTENGTYFETSHGRKLSEKEWLSKAKLDKKLGASMSVVIDLQIPRNNKDLEVAYSKEEGLFIYKDEKVITSK